MPQTNPGMIITIYHTVNVYSFSSLTGWGNGEYKDLFVLDILQR